MVTELRNATELKFTDISTEIRRTYTFPSGAVVTLEAPVQLNVGASGGHRVFTADGHSHYFPPTWIHIEWETKDGAPHFVK